MNRNKKTQILAIIGLLAIVFSIVSTALLVIFASRVPQEVKISDFVKNTQTGAQAEVQNIASGAVQVQ